MRKFGIREGKIIISEKQMVLADKLENVCAPSVDEDPDNMKHVYLYIKNGRVIFKDIPNDRVFSEVKCIFNNMYIHSNHDIKTYSCYNLQPPYKTSGNLTYKYKVFMIIDDSIMFGYFGIQHYTRHNMRNGSYAYSSKVERETVVCSEYEVKK